MLKQVNKLHECTTLNTWRTTQMNAKTMKTHLKTFLLHHELKNKECSINDPEWPVVPSVGLVKQTIVFTAFAHHYVFNSCEPSLLQTHRLFSLFIPSGHNLSLNYGKRYQCRMTLFFKNEMIVVWTLIRSLRTKQKPPKKSLFVYFVHFPLNQIIASCSKLYTALLLLPLVGLQTETSSALNLFELGWSAACWRLLGVFALGISLEDVYKCLCRKHNRKKRDQTLCFQWHTELIWIISLICWINKNLFSLRIVCMQTK